MNQGNPDVTSCRPNPFRVVQIFLITHTLKYRENSFWKRSSNNEPRRCSVQTPSHERLMDGMDVLAPYDRSLSHKTKETLVSSKTLKGILYKKRPLQKNNLFLDDKPHIFIKPPKPFYYNEFKPNSINY